MFLFRNSKEDLKESRERCLRDLKATFPSIVQSIHDENHYEFIFLIAQERHTMRIQLPINFPNEGPTIQIVGNVKHPWLDQHRRVIGSRSLLNWNKNSSLVDIIQEILSQMRFGTFDTPAAPSQHQHPRPGATLAEMYSGNSTRHLGTSSAHQAHPLPPPPSYDDAVNRTQSNVESATATRKSEDELLHTPMPVIPSQFPELKDLAEHQLQRLLDDSSALIALVDQQQAVEGMRQIRDDVRYSNMDHAMSNLANEDEVARLRAEVQSLQMQLKDALKEYNQELQLHMKKYDMSKPRVLQELQSKKSAIDRESSMFADAFVEGAIKDLGAFIQRINYHSLDLKMKKVSS